MNLNSVKSVGVVFIRAIIALLVSQLPIKYFSIQDAEQRASFIALHDGLKSLGTPDDIFGMSVS